MRAVITCTFCSQIGWNEGPRADSCPLFDVMF